MISPEKRLGTALPSCARKASCTRRRPSAVSIRAQVIPPPRHQHRTEPSLCSPPLTYNPARPGVRVHFSGTFAEIGSSAQKVTWGKPPGANFVVESSTKAIVLEQTEQYPSKIPKFAISADLIFDGYRWHDHAVILIDQGSIRGIRKAGPECRHLANPGYAPRLDACTSIHRPASQWWRRHSP